MVFPLCMLEVYLRLHIFSTSNKSLPTSEEKIDFILFDFLLIHSLYDFLRAIVLASNKEDTCKLAGW